MSEPHDDKGENHPSAHGDGASPMPDLEPYSPESKFEVEESLPDGGSSAVEDSSNSHEAPQEAEPEPREKRKARTQAAAAPAVVAELEDEEPAPVLVWYVLKVQSGREDTIREALERRVKIHGLEKYFGRIVVPTEKITEIRNNKKRVVERKSYPGYIMVEMELNERTWFGVRETPGVGDFVGAHGQPSPMREEEVNKMLGQETAKDERPAPVRIHVERGDRVKIKDGPFENFEGTVEEVIEQRGLVKVMLIIFNRPTPVDLEYWQVERI
jgi:transcriptional antiterminator NusG